MKKIGVSQKVILFNEKGEMLALRRSKTHPFSPFSWDLPGGDIEQGENPEKSIAREAKEETGLRIKNIRVFDVESHMHKNNDFWITIAYTAETNVKKVTLSWEHDEFRWISPQEFLKLKSSPKLKRFVKNVNNANV